MRLRLVSGRVQGIYGPVHHNSTLGIKEIASNRVYFFFGWQWLFQGTCGLADRQFQKMYDSSRDGILQRAFGKNLCGPGSPRQCDVVSFS